LQRKIKLYETISSHVKNNAAMYFVVVIFFAVGVAAGAFTVKALDDSQKQALIRYMQGFFQVFTTKEIDNLIVLKQSIINNIQTVFALWILGITIIGIPVTLLVIGIRGFIIGFTVGFMIEGLGVKGLFFSAAAILPQNMIIIPCMTGICVISISFSLMIIRNRLSRRWTNNYWQKFFSYTFTIVVLFGVIILGSLIEAYITPALIKALSSYLIT
jgi:stage II sporulation protein M